MERTLDHFFTDLSINVDIENIDSCLENWEEFISRVKVGLIATKQAMIDLEGSR